jgi:hypothetical protein
MENKKSAQTLLDELDQFMHDEFKELEKFHESIKEAQVSESKIEEQSVSSLIRNEDEILEDLFGDD